MPRSQPFSNDRSKISYTGQSRTTIPRCHRVDSAIASRRPASVATTLGTPCAKVRAFAFEASLSGDVCQQIVAVAELRSGGVSTMASDRRWEVPN